MKKVLFLLLGILSGFQCFGQDPDLFQTWYLYSIEFENGDLINVAAYDPPINPDLVITPSFDFFGQGACNTFTGNFIFTPPDFFEVENFNNTNNPCGFFEDQFEDEYFGFFYVGTQMISYIDTDANNEQTLILHGGIFTTLTYRNVPILSNPDFYKNNISIYPNPVANTLYISSGGVEIESFSVYTLTGKRLLEIKNTNHSIDISALSKGMYFLQIHSSDGIQTLKFIKK